MEDRGKERYRMKVSDKEWLAFRDSLTFVRQRELIRETDRPKLEAWLDAKEEQRFRAERVAAFGTAEPIVGYDYDYAED